MNTNQQLEKMNSEFENKLKFGASLKNKIDNFIFISLTKTKLDRRLNLKQTFYILTLTLGLLSCNGKTEKLGDKNSTVILTDNAIHRNKIVVGDSIFKIGDFLFEAKKNAKFEFIKKGDKSKIKTKGDTLYKDNDEVLFGDIK